MTQGRINIIDATPIEAVQSGSGNGNNSQSKKDLNADWYVKQDTKIT